MKCICRRSVIERGGSATLRNTNCRGRGKEVHRPDEGKGQSGKSGGIPENEKSGGIPKKEKSGGIPEKEADPSNSK